MRRKIFTGADEGTEMEREAVKPEIGFTAVSVKNLFRQSE